MKPTQRLLVIVLFLGWIFDFLFWEQEPGLSFSLFVAGILIAGLILTRMESITIPWTSLTLIIPIGFFAGMTFFRLEPFTRALNHLLTLGLLGLLAVSFTGGKWFLYSLSDYVRGYILLGVSGFIRPLIILSEDRNTSEAPTSDLPPTRKSWLPILGGILLALPLLILFASLLAAADPIFGEALESIFSWLQIDLLPEYIFRLILILIIAYLLAGLLDHAVHQSQDEKLLGEGQGWLRPFLGSIQTTTVLASIDLLFGAFVFFQFRYFFGGQVTLEAHGLTYSEYARKGFWELLAVGFLSILLFWGLSTITRREKHQERRRFSFLGIVLLLLVSVILISALQRLSLYENAFGFTRQRTYAHIFMIWLGILLAGLVLLEALRRQRAFTLAALLALLGFGITLNLVNVDRFIVLQNVNRARAGETLDTSYLMTLSPDAVPALSQVHLEARRRDGEPDILEEEIALTFACHAQRNNNYQNYSSWQSSHLSRSTANRIWKVWEAAHAPAVDPDECWEYWD